MTLTPTRIQLSRRKGWKMLPNTKSVARPGPFGNPFSLADAKDAGYYGPGLNEFVVDCFRNWLAGDRSAWMGEDSDRACATILTRLPELRGKNLACWCKPGQPCHADVLLELANQEPSN